MHGQPEHYMDPARVAEESRRHKNMPRIGLVPPTRQEIGSSPASVLEEWLDVWFHESPTLLIPNNSVVSAVRADLLQRSDAASPEVQSLIALCDRYTGAE